MSDRDERFATCITALAVATRGELDDPTIELYDRALADVPIHLLEAAAVELAKTSTFFPRPAEWRTAVDTILDRSERLKLAGSTQLQLPGEVGVDDWRCPDCDNTGWRAADRTCEKPACRPEGTPPGTIHTHRGVARCENTFCASRRQKAAEAKRRYGRKDD